jgi:SAM-dependent methyltransferase
MKGAETTPPSAAVRCNPAEIVEWDVENWSAALDYWQRHSTLTLSTCTALEIGSRHGGLSLWLALAGASVVCSDLREPTDAAVRKHERYGVSKSVRYARVDALHVPYAEAFDLLVFKSVLGGIGYGGGRERQRQAVSEMHKALKPGGELWFAENLVGSPVHRVLRDRFVDWAPRWRYVSMGELVEFLEPFASLTCHTLGVLGTFGRSERQRAILGRIDRLVVNALVPASWRYIAVGVARK